MILKIAQQLIENEFTPLIKDAGTDFFCGGKQVGACVYCVMAVNADNSDYKEKFERLSAFVASSYSQPNLSIVVVGIFATQVGVTAELEQFATANVETFEKVNFIKWVVAPDGVKIFGNQPDRLLNLRQIIDKARKSETSAQSVEDIIAQDKIKREDMLAGKSIWLTITMIIVLAVVFLAQLTDKQELMVEYGAMINPLYHKANWYRCFTAMFLHGGLDHLMANCLSLYIFGTRVERYYGKGWLFGIFMVTGVLANAVSGVFLDSYTYALGASGAIYGLMGAVLCYSIKTKRKLDGFDLYFLLTFVLIGFVAGSLMPNVDNTAHIAGFVFGMLAGLCKKVKKV